MKTRRSVMGAFAVMPVAAAIVCVAARGAALAAVPACDALRGRISGEVKELEVLAGALPGCLVADGVNAVPLAYGRSGQAFATVAAAGTCGKGRAVAVSHHGFFEQDAGKRRGNVVFLRECLKWLAGDAEKLEIRLDVRCSGMAECMDLALADCGIDFHADVLRSYGELASLPAGAVVVTMPDSHSLRDAPLLANFVRRGGGVLAPVVGWGWRQLNPGKSFASDNAFNVVFGTAGIYTGRDAVQPVRDGKFETCGKEVAAGTTAADALALLGGGGPLAKGASANCLYTMEELVWSLPSGDTSWRPKLEVFKASAADVSISPSRPLTLSNARERLAYILFQNEWLSNPRRVWPANAAAAAYPGVPAAGTRRVTKEVPVDLSVPRWHGTGLFAAAGEPLTVELPEGAEKAGLRIRVGTTTCRVTAMSEWRRAPVVDIELPLDRRTTRFSSPFGGAVYVVAPNNGSGTVVVKVGPACPMPRFIEGVDTPETWAAQLKDSPAPQVEMENDHIAITVPYAVAKDIADPRPLLQVWREIMDNDARLTAIPLKRESPERFCVDVQLCAGYMHAGYPIMVPTVCARDLVDEPGIRAGKKDNVWGFFHEMGHNHQNSDWTFDGTGEVTVNFFTLYNMERICGRSIRDNDKIGTPSHLRKVKRWEDAGRPFEAWKGDAFLALDFFAKLVEKYGWESFEKLFAEYRTLPQGEKPRTDLDKRRQWCSRLSRIVGKDLTPEFKFMLEK